MTGKAEKASVPVSRLSAFQIHKSFAAREVVGGVDLHIRRGEVVGLLGASGSGKSTIFNAIAGLLRPDEGRILLDSRDITRAGIDARARLGIGYVPQAPTLFGKLTAEENLRIAIEASGVAGAAVEPFLDTMCKAFNVEAFRTTRLANLSGGQRKWIEIAFAMCGKPRFLLLDEPFAGLDPIATGRLSAFVVRLSRLGIGILLTDHNVRNALRLVERAYVIDTGMIIASGNASDIASHGEVRSVFLGDNFTL